MPMPCGRPIIPLDVWLLDEAGKPSSTPIMVLTSEVKHMEQVAADIGMELVFPEKGVPRGRRQINSKR